MAKKYTMLVINPGSTSTKVAVYQDEESIFNHVVRHSKDELAVFDTIIDQFDFRLNLVLELLKVNNIDLDSLDAAVGRGGLIKPIPGGTYSVNEHMLRDLKASTYGQHASSLGGIIAHAIAVKLNIPSFIVNPIVVDELEPCARISGIPDIERKSILHALNQKAVAIRAAKSLGKTYEEVNFIVVHLGGGISIGAHRKGRIIDVNNALDGDGPFSPERSGGLPAGDLIRLCFSGRYTEKELMKKVVGQGGLMAYLGTNDGRQVRQMIQSGDKNAELIYEAMAYQIAKDIGAMAAVLKGDIDAIILTGGLAYDKSLIGMISSSVSFVAPIINYPGEDEMIALAEGALRVLRGEEKVNEYNL